MPENQSRTDKLARQILDDRAKPRPASNIGGCFLCGRSYLLQPAEGDGSTRFCGARCRETYDAGAHPFVELNVFAVPHWRIIAGPAPPYMPGAMRQTRQGCLTNCRNCKREFESKGLRCCSVECERGLKDKADDVAIMAEVGDAPAGKRKCEQCGGTIPNWIGEGTRRRRTPKSRRYCSARCRGKANKIGLSETSQRSGTLAGPPEAIPPVFGPSTLPLNLIGGYRFPGAPKVRL